MTWMTLGIAVVGVTIIAVFIAKGLETRGDHHD